MTVYTGRGDAGETDLLGAGRVSKAHPRIAAYGTVDETNALVGRARPVGHDDVDGHLREGQNHLHVLSAELAAPGGDGPRLDEADTAAVEAWIDSFDEELEPLDSFVLPGGSAAGADLHHARTVCRRAERRLVALAETEGESVRGGALTYVNRLSDALFVFARVVNRRAGHEEEHPTY